MRPVSLTGIFICLALTGTRGAAVPAWAVTAAAERVPDGAGLAIVANTVRSSYFSPGRARLTWRFALKLARADAEREIHFEDSYESVGERILDARAWVIGPDGSVRVYKRGDFTDNAESASPIADLRRLEFEGAGRVPVGGTLACEVDAEKPATALEAVFAFQPRLYAVDQVLEVVPPPGGIVAWYASSGRVPAPASLPEPGGLRWEMRAVPGLDSSPSPSYFLTNPMVVVARPEPAGQRASWDEIAQSVDGLMGPATAPTPEIAALATRLIAGKTDRWDRIRALANFVQQDVVTLAFSISRDSLDGYCPHPAGEVLRNRFGDSKDKAVLLMALLRAAGEDGRIMLLRVNAPQVVNPAEPSLRVLNRAIVGIAGAADAAAGWARLDEPDLLAFDPSDAGTPVGLLSPGDQGGWALVIGPTSRRLVRLPQFKGALHHVTRRVEAVLDADGELAATSETEYSGQPAAIEHSARGADSADFQRRLTISMQAVAPLISDLTWSDRWDPAALRYQLNCRFRVEDFGHELGGKIVEIQPDVFPAFLVLTPWVTPAEGISWIGTGDRHERVRIKLPAGYAVEEFPSDWDKHGSIVNCRLHYALVADAVVYEAEFSVEPGLYDKPRYEAIRVFCESFRAAQRRPVLLRRTVPPAHS